MLNLSSDEMEALVEHREKLDAELEQLRENRMELEAEIEGTDGVDAQATKLIEDMMALTRGEMNTLYRDSIIQVLSTKIDNYRKTDILQPSDDMVLEQDKVIMAGDINVTVRNVVQSVRGKE